MTGSGAVWALGAMSGTSLDGVDAAMVLTDGRTITSFGESAYQGYTDAQRETVRNAFGRTRDTLRDEEAAEVVETVHAAVLSRIHGAEVVGFHGQTLWHDPDNGVTLQVGDGAVLSEVLGLPVVWDFRTTDVLMGGQGAPLAPFFHHACARHVGAKAPVAFLNLGGVGNLTWVDPRLPDPALPGALLAFDTGPANAPINDLVTSRWGEPYDRGGAAAARGNVADAVIERMLAGSYFSRVPPKSLDRDHFSGLAAEVADLSDDDAAATLTCAAAAAVARGMVQCPEPPTRLLVTGGGRRNPVLMEMLSVLVDFPVAPVEDAGLDGDMLEAQAFAYLAVRVMQGLSTSSPGTTGVRAPVGGGTISRPGDLQVTRRLPGAQPAGISKSGSASVKPSN